MNVFHSENITFLEVFTAKITKNGMKKTMNPIITVFLEYMYIMQLFKKGA